MPRFTVDADNNLTDTVSGEVSQGLAPWAAALVARSGNAADAMMRCTGSIGCSHSEGGYTVHVDRMSHYVTEDN